MITETMRDRLVYSPQFGWADIPYLFETASRARVLDAVPGNVIMRSKEQEMKSKFSKAGVPVLICAFNEQEDLPRLLYALSQSSTSIRPIIIDNGSEDGTVDIARTLNLTVVEEKAPGLVNARRAAFRFLDDSNLTDKVFLSIDSDGIPGRRWAKSMLKATNDNLSFSGGQIFGFYLYYGGSNASDFLLTCAYQGNGISKYFLHKKVSGHGCSNFALKFDSEGRIIKASKNLDQRVTTGNGALLRDSIRSAGGNIFRTMSPLTVTPTRSDKYPDFLSVFRLMMKKGHAIRSAYQSWYDRKPGINYRG